MRPRLTALLLLACVVAPGWAATYQVGPSRTHKNLNGVSARLRAGDVVEVDGGATYVGQVTFRTHGASGNPIVIRGIDSGGGRPHLSTSGGVAGGSVVRFWGNHYVFENFEVSANREANTARGMHMVAENITVRDCIVHDIAGQGIHGSDTGGTVILERVEVYRCGLGSFSHQIYMATNNEYLPNAFFRMTGCYLHDALGGNNVKSRAGRTEIYYNWIEGSANHELDLIGADPAAQLKGSAGWVREDAEVVGNVLRKSSGVGYFARLGTDTTGASNGRYRFFHNTFIVDPAFKGPVTVFSVKSAVQTLELFNNVIYSPVAKLRVLNGGAVNAARTSGANNWISAQATDISPAWTGTISGTDPGFRNAAALDFAPRADGALFGAGAAATTSPAGYDFPNPLATPAMQPCTPASPATTRPVNGTPDIGAFDLPDSAPGQANAPPQSVDDVVNFVSAVAQTAPVLANDSDADGDAFAITSITRALYGTVRLVGNTIVYTPGKNFPGEEVFTYRISDGRAVSAATLTFRNPYFPVRGAFSALFVDGDINGGFAGTMRVKVDAFGAFTGTVQLGSTSYSFLGTLDLAGAARISITRKKLPALNVALNVDFTTASLTATIGDGTRLATAASDRVFYDKTHPLPHTGNYTVLLPPPAQRSYPHGNGYATISVSAAGVASIAGTLGDGTAFSAGGSLHADGTLPVFASPSTKVRGVLAGTFTFTGGEVIGLLTWWKPAQPSGLYREGFLVDLSAVATRWTQSTWRGGRATVNFTGGDLSVPATSRVQLAVKPAVSAVVDGGGVLLSFDVAKSSGLFKGRILHPVLNRAIDVRGAVLQPQEIGAGLFVGNTATGAVDVALGP